MSKVPSPGADETAFPIRDVKYKEAFPTNTSSDAGQDMENTAKTSAMPHEALTRVTSLGGGEGKAEGVAASLLSFSQRLRFVLEFWTESDSLLPRPWTNATFLLRWTSSILHDAMPTLIACIWLSSLTNIVVISCHILSCCFCKILEMI
nr:hypothetical protein [Tanacetum cinerariifolium]